MKFIRSDIKSPVPFAKRQTLSKNWMPRLRREQRSTHTEREEHTRTGHICVYIYREREGGERLYLLRKREKTDQLRAMVISLIGDWKVSTERERERDRYCEAEN